MFTWGRILKEEDDKDSSYHPETCEKHLEVLQIYIESFNAFLKLLNEPVEQDLKDLGGLTKKSKMTYFQRMLSNLENPKNDAQAAFADQINDFRAFEPTGPANR